MWQPSSFTPKGRQVIRAVASLLHVGPDTGTPVADSDYQVPFAFTGKLEKATRKHGAGE